MAHQLSSLIVSSSARNTRQVKSRSPKILPLKSPLGQKHPQNCHTEPSLTSGHNLIPTSPRIPPLAALRLSPGRPDTPLSQLPLPGDGSSISRTGKHHQSPQVDTVHGTGAPRDGGDREWHWRSAVRDNGTGGQVVARDTTILAQGHSLV